MTGTPEVITVFCGPEKIGRIIDLGHAMLWEWDADYAVHGRELSPVLPLAIARSEHRDPYFHRLPPLLADSLPDSFGLEVMNESLKQLGYTNITTMDRLAYVGNRGVGALSFVPTREEDPLSQEVDIELLRKYATKYKTEPSAVSWKILRRTTNLGGAQPKSAVSYHPVSGSIHTGITRQDGFLPVMVKFQQEPEDGQTNAEYALAQLARESGIRMPETLLIRERGYVHFAVERFDIAQDGTRIHYQSYAAMTGNHYAPYTSPDYVHLHHEVKKRTAHYQDVLEIFRRMVFSIVVNNWDDHQRNHGFLMDGDGNWRLSPAFDITYAIPGSNDARACSVNRKGFAIGKDDCLEVARSASLDERDVQEVFDQIRASLFRWPGVAEAAGLSEELTEEIEKNFVKLYQ